MATAADPQDYSFLFDLWLVLHLSRRTLDDALAHAGLPADDFALYHLIAVNGPLTPTQIVNWTGMRRSTVSSYLRRMTERDHANSTANPDDGRSYLIELTDTGRSAYNEAAARFNPVLDHIEDELAVPASQVRGALEQLDHALRRLSSVPARPYTLPPARRPTSTR